MDTKERIKAILDYSHLSVKEFVLKTGIKTMQAIYDLQSGKTKSISASIESKILSCFPEINRVWLLTGEGSMLIEEQGNTLPVPQEPVEKDGNIRYWTDVSATGGSLEFLENPDEHTIRWINVPNFSECTDAVNFWGDSMTPLYHSGEVIILKEWNENFINYGHVYLVITRNGNRMVKYLRKSADENKVLCVSENKEFDPFEIDKADILKLYLVKGSIKKNAT